VATERAVLLDTDAFSALYVTPEKTAIKQGHPLDAWRAALRGHRVVICFHTRAELLIGARYAKWGEPRVAALRHKLDATPTVQLDDEVLESFVALTADARAQGSAIWEKVHTGDRWIAAAAIAKSLPLLARDTIYADAPALVLFEVPGT
jgi:predicted nucleic acid-binding protein